MPQWKCGDGALDQCAPMNHTKNGSVLPLCGQHILGGSRAPLSYLLERDMHRHRFPFLAGEDTPQTTLSHPSFLLSTIKETGDDG